MPLAGGDLGVESAAGPRMVVPTTLTLQLEAGWPTGTAEYALNELVGAINAAIDRAGDARTRAKLERVRDGLVGVARDVVLA
jgi:hypothetical protein